MNQIKAMWGKQIFKTNLFITIFNILLLISIISKNKYLTALVIVTFTLPTLLLRLFGKLKLNDKPNPLWTLIVVLIAVLMVLFTDVLYIGNNPYLRIVIMQSFSLIAVNAGMLGSVKNVDNNNIVLYTKKLAIISGGLGIFILIIVFYFSSVVLK